MIEDYKLIQPLHWRLWPSPATTYFLTIPGPPWSKSRPRFGTKRGYRDPKDRAAELRTRAVFTRYVAEPFTGNVAVTCMFFRPNRQRIDADNLIKHVCDSGNGILWLDDSQVTAACGIIELDAQNPRTIVMVGEHESTMTRGTDYTVPCKACGAAIVVKPGAAIPTYCSKDCARSRYGDINLSAPVPCKGCGQPFVRKTSEQKHCGIACVPRKGVPRPSMQKPKPTCADCGATVSKPGYVRCRVCWKSARTERVS